MQTDPTLSCMTDQLYRNQMGISPALSAGGWELYVDFSVSGLRVGLILEHLVVIRGRFRPTGSSG